MKLINDEMRDMLMMAKDTKSAIKEMNEAFSGELVVDYVATVRGKKTKVSKISRRQTVDRNALTAQNKELEPIYEVDDSRALVAF